MAASERQQEKNPHFLRIFDPKARESSNMNGEKINIIHNLMNRETFGSFSRKHARTNQRPQAMKPLQPNSCFTFALDDLIPESALKKGHIVLGLSRCGQFLLSYTVGSFDPLLGYTHSYILHWWACVPRGKAHRVAEVTLFKDQGVDPNLLFSVCQWPNDNSKILIYGVSEPLIAMATQSQVFYLTVTMVPSLKCCDDCKYVASTLDDEDSSPYWDNCVKSGCLKHSATIHTSCEFVSPYPEFEPEVSLKLDGTVIINTGNFLHVLRIDLESADRSTNDLDPVLQATKSEVDEEELLSSMMLQNCEVAQVRSASGPHASPIMFLKSPQYLSSEDDDHQPQEKRPKCSLDSESDDSIIYMPRVATKKEKFFTVNSRDHTPKPKPKQLAEAEKVFEFIDENPPDIKLSAFRLRRLADKKYEFCAEEVESENITPYRRQESPIKKHEGSPQPTSASQSQQNQRRLLPQQATMQELIIHTSPPFSPSGDVLRPLNSNSLASVQQLGSPTAQQLEEHKASPRPHPDLASPGGHCRSASVAETRKSVTYLVKLQRRYFEVDDEVVSVITDIEDDDLGALTGYHSALPLEVHGSGYAQMQMVSNSKAEKLRAACILVQQTSFDIEQFCHEVAQVMCAEAGVKYWYCKDYDVEIFDVCPDTGDVVVVAFLLLQATNKKSMNKNTRLAFNGMQRRTYQGSFIFSWNLETGRYWVLSTSALREQEQMKNSVVWHPARAERQTLRRLVPPLPTQPPIRCLMNRSVIRGQSLTSLLDAENHMRIVLK